MSAAASRLAVLWAAAALLLSGCWIGDNFYQLSESRHVLPAGDYRLRGDSAGMLDSGAVRVSHLPDGTTRLVPISENGTTDEGDAFALGLAALGGSEALAVAWVTAMEEQATNPDMRLYGVLRRNADGSHSLLFPTCEGEGLTAARAAGAEVVGGPDRPGCRFPSRAALEAALRAMAPQLDSGFRLTPLLPPAGGSAS
ncbi:MAG TPA: hypothetical protein VF704_07915 [Allosphingosinicella sp.]|jgi:hypothetical protein